MGGRISRAVKKAEQKARDVVLGKDHRAESELEAELERELGKKPEAER